MAEPSKARLGNYELLEVIGNGSEGRVYRARCCSRVGENVVAGEMVALKRLRETGDADGSLRFYSQADLLRRLDHPNIIRYKDSFVWREGELDQEIYCLVTELLEGGVLKSRIEGNQSGLSWVAAKPLLAQTLVALNYAIAQGVIHRDLKPSNIYVTNQGQVKLIDFGIARPQDSGATNASVAGFRGTFDYMAPDFIHQPAGFRGDEQSDIFSFGICLYETLAGRLPFPPLSASGANSQLAFLQRYMDLSKAPKAKFTPDIFSILRHASTCIGKCIAINREDRYQTFAELTADFKRIRPRLLTHADETYEYTEFLGRGGFGKVFRARRLHDGQDTAIKEMLADNQASRFISEAKILQKIDHPHLVRYLDFVEVEDEAMGDNRKLFLVLEYLRGMPGAGLRERIKKSKESKVRLPWLDMLRLFADYLDCLEYLHGHGIIHRDIKPGNLYAPEESPGAGKIFDLGIAHDTEGTRTHGQVPGTLDYMPPEFAGNESGRGSPQSDIYSIGLTLYEALTSETVVPRLPRKDGEAWIAFYERSQTPLKCAFENPVFKEHPQLVPLLRRAIAHLPKERFPSAAAMRDAINRIIDDETRPPRPPGECEDREGETLTETDGATAATIPIEDELEDIVVNAPPRPAPRKTTVKAPVPADDAEPATSAPEPRKVRTRELEPVVAAPAVPKPETLKPKPEHKPEPNPEPKPKPQPDQPTPEELEERLARSRRTVKIFVSIFIATLLAVGGYFGWLKYAEFQKAQFEKYRLASVAANAAFEKGDFATSIAQAEKALEAKKGDVAMESLKGKVVRYKNVVGSYKKAVGQADDEWGLNQFAEAADQVALADKSPPDDPIAQQLCAPEMEVLKRVRNSLGDKVFGLTNEGSAALAATNYTLASKQAGLAVRIAEALGISSGAANDIRSKADRELAREKQYFDAIAAASAALTSSNYTLAITHAKSALSLKPKDATALKIWNDAEKRQENVEERAKIEREYQAAITAARSAMAATNYSLAVTRASEALGAKANDSEALKIKRQAESEIEINRQFIEALEAARLALLKTNYTLAMTNVTDALALKPTNLAALKTKSEVEGAMSSDKNYFDALAGAEAAMLREDYTNSIAKLVEALKWKPNDPTAEQLKSQAKKFKEIDEKYRAAMRLARELWVQKDTNALVKAQEALQHKQKDSAAEKLAAEVVRAMALAGATAEFAQCHYDRVEELSKPYADAAVFKELLLKTKEERELYLRLTRRYGDGDYTFLSDISPSLADKPFFRVLGEQGRVEEAQLDQLRGAKSLFISSEIPANWKALTNGLATLPPRMSEKKPFADVRAWVNQNDPVRKLDGKLATYSAQLGVKMPNNIAVPVNVKNIPVVLYLDNAAEHLRMPVVNLTNNYSAWSALSLDRLDQINKLLKKIDHWE